MVQVQVWWSYCPVGECNKGHSHLGRSYSEKRARQRIFDHLVGSPQHLLTEVDAHEFADAACEEAHTLQTEMAEEEPWNPNQQPVAKRQRRQHEPVPSSGSSHDQGSAVAVPVDLGEQIRMQTRNAFVFVKALLFS